MTESIWFTDTLMRIHVTPEVTNGAYALIEVLAPAGHMPPPHIHDRDDESFLVIEGEVTVHTNDGATVVRAGQVAHVAAGEPHTICVTGADPVRALIVAAPGDLAGYFRACGRPAEREELPVLTGPPDVELLVRQAPAHGMTLLGAPGTVPADLIARA